jgi:sugar phosphate isomerase/epimerase
MKALSRRSFVRNSALAMAGISIAGTAFAAKKNIHRLSFSTLGCPEWPLPDILTFAELNGFKGIEIRGILGELDLTKCPDFDSKDKIVSFNRIVEDKQLKIVDLGSSAQLHHADAIKRKNNLDSAKKFIDLAGQLNCPYIRVFPDSLPKDQKRKATIDLIINGLIELGEYARGSNVSVLLESHGDGVEKEELFHIMENSAGAHTGMVWDICNMWSVTRESPSLVYDMLKKYIRYTHIRDIKIINGVEHCVLLGQGEAPVKEAVQALEQGNYNGFYGLEWEKLWQPEIEEPGIAFTQFSSEIKKYFKT